MDKFELTNINTGTASRVLANNNLNRYLINNGLYRDKDMLDVGENTRNGSIVYTTMTDGDDFVLVGGVHGNELASQVALLRLIGNIYHEQIRLNHRLHIIPFLIPASTSRNTREYNGEDMNRNAFNNGPTKDMVDYAVSVDAKGLCDCHSTDPSLTPGINSVFCSFRPQKNSYFAARYICQRTSSKLFPIGNAGSILNGAVEDESNLRGIASVTCEAACINGKVTKESVDFSYNQIMSFLEFYDIIKK